jgi:hypothetical protein
MSWYATGDDADRKAAAELARQEQARAEAAKNSVRRLWLPASGETTVTILDDAKHPEGYPLPFVFNEHQLKMNGHWRNWYTCIGEGCPICAQDNRPNLMAAYTVINHAEFTDKKGNVRKDETNLLMVKPAINKILRKAASRRGPLRGWKVEITRNTEQSYSSGDVFDFLERREIGDDLQPVNYLELFEPKCVEDLNKLFGGTPMVDADDSAVKF